jgi:RNA polymerase II subunit A-like phosphatase
VRKLALILDLDNTLIHACPAPFMEEGQPAGMEENMHYIRFTEQIISQGPVVAKFTNKQAHYIKLRDGLMDFLLAASKLYQLSVYTHGTRAYAEAVVAKIDPDRTLIGRRIVSRYIYIHLLFPCHYAPLFHHSFPDRPGLTPTTRA